MTIGAIFSSVAWLCGQECVDILVATCTPGVKKTNMNTKSLLPLWSVVWGSCILKASRNVSLNHWPKNYLVYPHLNSYILLISSSLKMIFWVKTFSKCLGQPCSWDALVSMTPGHLKLQGWPTFQAFWCRLCLRTYQNHSHTMVVHSAYSIWPWMKNTALCLGNFIHTMKWL